MPRKTNYRLTQEQEQQLSVYLGERYTSLRTDNSDRIRLDVESLERYYNDVERRKGIAESIYPLSNIPIPTYAMCIDAIGCRVEEATVGDKNYWHFQAVGNEDENKAQIYTDYFTWKLTQGGVHKAMLEAQLPALLQCAQISKATYQRDEIWWVDFDASVLHDRTTGSPVETITDGPVILGEDSWTDQPDPVGIIGQIGNAFGIQSEPTMRKHLASDPSLIFDPRVHYWAPPSGGVKRSQIIYSGAKSENVRFDRFYCAMDAANIETSDTMELQDRALDWYRSNWLERPWAQWAVYEPQIKTGDTTSKVNDDTQNLGIGQPTFAKKQENRAFDHVNPVRRIAEFWCTRDCLGGGSLPPQKFVAWWDIDLKVLINYEWQAKVSPDLKKPYTITSLVKEPNRWCGKSIWQRGKPLFDGIDRMFNGVFYRALQQANPPKGGDPTAAREEPTDIAYDPTKYYELNKGRTIDELLAYAKVPDTNQRSDSVMNFLIYTVQLWLSVSNLAQGDYSDLPSNNTATGIDTTIAETSLSKRSAIRRKLESDEEHLTKLVKIVIATIKEDAKEIFEFTSGDRRMAATIMGAEVRTLNMHVSVVEQTHFKQADIDRCKTALQVIAPYFQQLNKEVRAVMRPFILEILHQLGFKNAEKKLLEFEGVPLTSEMGGALEMGPQGQPQLPQQEPPAASLEPPPPPPPVKGSLTVAAKLDQLSVDERTQLFGEIGIKEPPGGAPESVAPPHGPKDPNPQPKPAAKK